MPTRRAPDSGITLVEILVVLSILAVASGVMMLRFGIGQGGAPLQAETAHVASEITRVADLALASGGDWRLSWRADVIRFDPVLQGEPEVIALDFARVATPSGNHLLSADGVSQPLTLIFAANGTSASLRFDGATAGVLP